MGLFHWLEEASAAAIPPDPAPDSPPVRRRFRFSGTVQGVGFRYEARWTASQLDLTGWARNERDGTVTVEAEGPETYVSAFLLAIESVPRFHITEVQTENLPLSGTETAFRILY